MRRVLTLALTTAVVLGGGAAFAGGGVIDEYKTGDASSVEVAALEALPTIQRSFSDFTRPIDANAAAVDYDGPRLTGLSAVTMEVDGDGFIGLSSMDDVTGPDGEYLARIGFDVNSYGDTAYYSTNQWATLYIAEFDGEPVAPEGGVVGVSLAWNWAGEQGLTITPFPNDPMTGFANNAEEGTVDSTPFRSFYAVAEGSWNEYEHQLLTMSGPVKRDRTWFFGWVVPGVPETAAATLSYATDIEDPSTLISQQIEAPRPLRFGFPDIVMGFSNLSIAQQLGLEDQWALHAPTTSVTTETEKDTEERGVLVDGAAGGGDRFEAWQVLVGVGILLLISSYIFRKARGGVRAVRPPQPREESDGPIPEDNDPIDMSGGGVVPS